MNYNEAKRLLVDSEVEAVRRHLKAACEIEAQGNSAEFEKEMKLARVRAGRMYTNLGNAFEAVKAGRDPIEAITAAETQKETKRAEREAKKIAKAETAAAEKAAAKAAKAAAKATETVDVDQLVEV